MSIVQNSIVQESIVQYSIVQYRVERGEGIKTIISKVSIGEGEGGIHIGDTIVQYMTVHGVQCSIV